MKVLVIYGTRPEAIKLAPVAHALGAIRPTISVVTIATGQHREMAAAAAATAGLSTQRDLDVMTPNQSPDQVMAATLTALPAVLEEEHPNVVVVQGDTTSAAAAALAAFHARVPVAHVEAGLRTGDIERPFPEEMNRKLIATLASLHFAPTPAARSNLLAEGVRDEQVLVTGNTVIDSLRRTSRFSRCPPGFELAKGRRLVMVTAHRRENIGAPLDRIALAIGRIAERSDVQVVVAMHANPRVRESMLPLGDCDAVDLLEPLAHDEVAWLLSRCHLLLTDSGGLQEEASMMGVPVVVVREVTERPEVVDSGLGVLVGTGTERIVDEVCRILDDADVHRRMAVPRDLYGDGRASERIAAAISERFRTTRSS